MATANTRLGQDLGTILINSVDLGTVVAECSREVRITGTECKPMKQLGSYKRATAMEETVTVRADLQAAETLAATARLGLGVSYSIEWVSGESETGTGLITSSRRTAPDGKQTVEYTLDKQHTS